MNDPFRYFGKVSLPIDTAARNASFWSRLFPGANLG
jgi:hypothetical protein